jgi:hypothetical protein
MRDMMESYADLSIRRAIAFVGLAVAVVMLSLSFEPVLSLRTGAEMAALLVVGLGFAAWRAPYRNLRHSEVYALLREAGMPSGRLAQRETQAEMGGVLRERLWWHAERVAVVALALWALSAAVWLVR